MNQISKIMYSKILLERLIELDTQESNPPMYNWATLIKIILLKLEYPKHWETQEITKILCKYRTSYRVVEDAVGTS